MLDEIGIILNFDPPAIAFSLELLTALAAPLVTKLYADAMKRQLAGRYLHFALIHLQYFNQCCNFKIYGLFI